MIPLVNERQREAEKEPLPRKAVGGGEEGRCACSPMDLTALSGKDAQGAQPRVFGYSNIVWMSFVWSWVFERLLTLDGKSTRLND